MNEELDESELKDGNKIFEKKKFKYELSPDEI